MHAHAVKLTGKTLKGKNKLREAGNPEHWTVLKQQAMVGFSDREGPWLLVAPENKSHYDHQRWVSLTDDHDFFVEIVR